MKLLTTTFVIALAFNLVVMVSSTQAVFMISDDDIFATTGNEIHSGNGTLDYMFFTESMGGAGNISGTFNGDNANTDSPTGGGGVFNESYITSIGELRDFYTLNFPDNQGGSTVNEMIVFIDINQTPHLDLALDVLTIIVDYDPFGDVRDDPFGNDILSSIQNSTGDTYSGGTILAQLDGPKILSLVEQGAGWADYGIHTGINPFDEVFSDETRILLHWESHNHDDGGETIFLSGEYAGEIPEPSMFGLLLLGVSALLRRKRK